MLGMRNTNLVGDPNKWTGRVHRRFLFIEMLSLVLKNSLRTQIVRRAGISLSGRFYATKAKRDDAETPKQAENAEETVDLQKQVEKASSKKDGELPDFPEYPFIRSDFESGIRSREYLKSLPTEKRIDLLSKKEGEIVYFDEEEFKHYFPHE